MRMLSLGADFMVPFWGPEIGVVRVDLDGEWRAQIEEAREDAVFAYSMNASPPHPTCTQARDLCSHLGIPTIWHTVEDPNHHDQFCGQADGFDLIATTDAICIPRYLRRYPRAKVIWLPLAAQPTLHYPVDQVAVVDAILIANWYTGAERMEAVRQVVEPVVDSGISFRLYAYRNSAWPEKYRRHWAGETSCYEVARYYPEGRVALGINNQAHGTTMTSMRTFEALACGRPLLASWSEAYSALGFVNGEHLVWVGHPEDALAEVHRFLAEPVESEAMGARGRAFVLGHHTYAHRLRAILETLW